MMCWAWCYVPLLAVPTDRIVSCIRLWLYHTLHLQWVQFGNELRQLSTWITSSSTLRATRWSDMSSDVISGGFRRWTSLSIRHSRRRTAWLSFDMTWCPYGPVDLAPAISHKEPVDSGGVFFGDANFGIQWSLKVWKCTRWMAQWPFWAKPEDNQFFDEVSWTGISLTISLLLELFLS